MKEVQPAYREQCYVCRRVKKHCLCGSVKPFATRTRFVILMHEEEARKQKTGTGRLAALCLANAELLTGTDFTDNAHVNALLADPAYVPYVLYPGPRAVNFQTLGKDALPAGKTLLVFVIDGTWRTAKSLLNKSRNVRALPRLSFAGKYLSRFSIKRQPMAHCVSTIEAIYHLCAEAEAAGYEKIGAGKEVLPGLLKELVDTQAHYRLTVGHRREDNKRKGAGPAEFKR